MPDETSIELAQALRSHAKEVKSIEKTARAFKINNKSIIKRAKETICYFPVYVSSSIRINEATVVAKLYERVYADFVQNVFSQPDNQFVDFQELEDFRFLKKFHVNTESAKEIVQTMNNARQLLLETFGGEPLDFTESTIHHSCYNCLKLSDNVVVEFTCISPSGKTYDMIAEHKRLIEEPLTGFSYLNEGYDDNITTKQTVNKTTTTYTDKETGKEVKRKDIDFKNKKAKNYVDNYVPHETKITSEKMPEEGYEFQRVGDRYQTAGKAAQILKDTDVRKINSMLPYSIIATFKVKNTPDVKWTRDVIEVQIGIKTVLHVIQPKDLIDEVKPIIMGGQKSLQKIRYKTGEITFKDYFLGLNSLKQGAAQLYKKSTRWLGSLKRLGEYGKLYKTALRDPVTALTKNKGIPIPNATLVLSALDVDNIKLGSGIDLNNPRMVRKLAKQIFLINFVIVDSSSGVIKSLYPEEQDDWDNMSIASIEELISKSSNADFMKELKRTINR